MLSGLLLLLVVVGWVGGGVARAAGVSSSVFGVDVATFVTSAGKLGPTDLSVASGSGVGVVRAEFGGGGAYDGAVSWLAAAHLRLYPILAVPCSDGSDSSCSNQWSPSPSVAAVEIAQVVRSLAQRYGVGGSFWKANPQLPYLPIEDFEIGNEPNLPLQWVVDSTHLHWSDPADYAEVYEAARGALHAVDPSGVAVVGGLADSAGGGVDVQSDEQWLGALTSGAVDAVGYHVWTYKVSNSLLETDTTNLRSWMDANGLSGVPLQISEVGACGPKAQSGCQANVVQSSAGWGSVAVGFMKWAVCTSWVNVDNFLPYYWGDTPTTGQDNLLPLVSSDGTETAFGQDYLAEVKALTTGGCPSPRSTDVAPANTAVPTVDGPPVSGALLTAFPGAWTGNPAPTFAYQWERCQPSGSLCSDIGDADSATYLVQPADVGSTLVVSVTAFNSASFARASSRPTALVRTVVSGRLAVGSAPKLRQKVRRAPSMDLRITRITRRGRNVIVTVRYRAKSGSATVTALEQGRRRARLRFKRHRKSSTSATFTAKLPVAHWLVTVVGKPTRGYAKPKQQRRKLNVASARSTRWAY